MASVVKAKAIKINLVIEAGATFDPSWTWKVGATQATAVPVDLTGATARLQVRDEHGSSTILLELTTANGGIILGDAAGTVALLVTDEASTAFTWEEGVYDLEIEFTDGKVRRWSSGTVRVSPNVTK